MTEKLEKQLVEDFPFLKKTYPFYGEGDIEIIKMLRTYGIQCSEGWYDLLHNLCAEITDAYADASRTIDMENLRIKEEFGRLCFYYKFAENHNSDFERKISDIVYKYCRESFYTCEECGARGERRSDEETMWQRTLCDDCYEALLREDEEYWDD